MESYKSNCFCGSQKSFSECCQLLINNIQKAQSALELMKSRYSAFCVKDMDYLISTTDPKTRENFNFKENKKWAEQAKFFKLEIVNNIENKDSGIVEFRAHFNFQGQTNIHHEISQFRRNDGVWYYSEGQIKT